MHAIASLEGYLYTASNSSDIFYSYLYHISRLGCGQVPDKFYITRDNSYRYYVLHYVYGGSGILKVNDTHFKLMPGDLFILGPGKPHLYASDNSNNLKLLWVEFSGSNTSDLISILLNKNIHLLSQEYSSVIANKILDLLIHIQNHPKPNPFETSEMLYGLILKTIELGLKNYEHQIAFNPLCIPPHIQKSLQFIEEHLHANIKISDLAKAAHCSPPYLSKSFSAHIGISPYKYILIKKIEYALVHILNDDVTATQLADELGFVDTTHFTKVFKKVTGQSISAYKKQALSQIK